MLPARKINCLAVDDEPLALEVIKKYVAAVPMLWLSATARNAVEALNVLQKENVDLMFLDIQMPFLQGTDFLRTLPQPPKVIFTTAFRKFAVEGFELDAVDFLLKPISFERFLKSVNKLMKMHFPELGEEPLPVQVMTVEKHIFLRAERRNIRVELDEILFVESVKDYVKVILRSHTIISKTSISSMQETLPLDRFIRVHRSFIVSRDKVTSYSIDGLRVGEYLLPVSRSYRHEAEKALKGK